MPAPTPSAVRWNIVYQKYVLEHNGPTIASNLALPVSTVYDVLRLYAATSDVEPLENRGRPRKASPEEMRIIFDMYVYLFALKAHV